MWRSDDERAASIGVMTTPDFDDLLAAADAWGADHVAVAVVGPLGVLADHGDLDRVFRWASVTKPVTALSTLQAVDDGLIDLDEPAGPPDSTVRHLLAHTSGLPFDGTALLGPPGRRRIYSNTGFDLLGDLVAERRRLPFDQVVDDWILAPLGMGATSLVQRPSQGLEGTLRDLATLAREFLRPTLLRPATAAAMVGPAFPGVPGLVPGVGRFDDCAWGLGVELHATKTPHWMGSGNSPAAFGHFGGTGTFLWVEPELDLAVAALTDREYGPWALEAWPRFSDTIIDRWSRRPPPAG